jgi:uncharacterized protein (DUF4415 family)
MPKLKPDHISLTPEEDAIVTAAAMADPDSGYLTDEEWAELEPYAFIGRYPPKKVAISIRLDQVVLDYFKAGGAGWQGRIKAALRRIAETEPVSVQEPDAPDFDHKK